MANVLQESGVHISGLCGRLLVLFFFFFLKNNYHDSPSLLSFRFWECIEMFRKFLMTSVLVNLIAVGQPEQIAAGEVLART
jgi:hypothetical protein